ncbi:MSMEG_0565 family glycosyltransferase [Xylophilus sp. GOD-11R]|uniref:MSMEG_0565 family glycosyltransferase n=1 Tax=Xylophilus sp. GOD-11R TaxID=3089814 RepID=UPI00298CD5F4|nr:MSMEG_0565 family glycosyltransferase [Xylophilus sp. GOD-11R]WPB55606.1 MSMEG_0565 family glycosyltransferase [Xylophilus sp. GOD-11R]
MRDIAPSRSPLRIGLLTHSVLPRGGVVHTLELAGALARRGHRVTVIAPAEAGQTLFRDPGAPDAPVHLALLPAGTIAGPLVEQVRQRIAAIARGLPTVLEAGDFDLLHVHDSLGGNALADLHDRGHRLPAWLRTIHHLDDFADPQLAAWQARAWRSAQAIGCVSDTWCRHLDEQHGRIARRLHNGVDLRRFKPTAMPGEQEALRAAGLRPGLTCLAVGGVEHRKNSLRLLHAFARLRRTDPRWAEARLVIAGGASLLDHSASLRGWFEALADLGWNEGPDQPVWRTGPLPDTLLPALMRHATVLAMPSLMEGFGLVALEALACGTPALVSRRAPFTEHLAGCAHVGWCDPEDIASIAHGLQATALLPRPDTPPPVCLAHGWDASAERHEDWYRATLATGVRLPAEL